MVGLTAYRLNRKCENRQNRECENTALKLQEIPFQRLKNSKNFKKTQTFPGVAFPKPHMYIVWMYVHVLTKKYVNMLLISHLPVSITMEIRVRQGLCMYDK